MDNIVKDFDQGRYVDIFGGGQETPDNQSQGNPQDNLADTMRPKFGGSNTNEVDIFSSQEPNKDEPVNQDDSNKDQETKEDDENKDKDVDILGQNDPEKPKSGRKSKYDFTDASGYFENRVKEKKFVPIMQTAEDGTEQVFVPKTPEEFDEFIDLQVEHQLSQRGKEVEQRVYQSKSPAWQTILKYSEMVDNPQDVIPFIQGIQTIESVAEIDETDPVGAEQIVRVRMEQRGEPQDVIDEQVELLRANDRLVKTAQTYKPLILQQEKKELALMAQQQKQREVENEKIITGIREGIIKAIEAPIVGNKKLTKEERIAVYSLVGEPTEESGGYAIYDAIDNLFQKGDFETLKKVALFLAKEDSFVNYISATAADKTATGLQNKLRIASEQRGGSASSVENDDAPVIKRDSYKQRPAFGRA